MVTLKNHTYAIEATTFIDNPSHKDLRRFTEDMPNAHNTVYGNLNVLTRVDARSTSSTYIVTDNPEKHRGHQTMSRAEYETIVEKQEAYIRSQEMIVIDGYISNAPEVQTAARLIIERANANVAGMQKFLYFPRQGGEPQVTVIYTPNLVAEGYPNDRCIAVDLENGVTRVLNSDYFGESKKGGLRMWNKIVYDKGGLPMHAGAKVVRDVAGAEDDRDHRALRDGQDDVDVPPAGQLEAGAGRLHRADAGRGRPRHRERLLREDVRAVTRSTSRRSTGRRSARSPYLENVYMDEDGNIDFFNESFTQNGRAVFPLEALGRFEDARNIPPVYAIVILNRARARRAGAGEALAAAGRGLLHARRDAGHERGRQGRGGEGAASARDEPVLPAAARGAGQPLPRAPPLHPRAT